MPITFCSEELWGTAGTQNYVEGRPVEAIKRSAFPGVDGNLVLTMGQRNVPHRLRGVLITDSDASMDTLWTNLKTYTGSTGTLVDHHSNSHSNMTLTTCQPSGPRMKRGARYYQWFYASFDQSGG